MGAVVRCQRGSRVGVAGSGGGWNRAVTCGVIAVSAGFGLLAARSVSLGRPVGDVTRGTPRPRSTRGPNAAADEVPCRCAAVSRPRGWRFPSGRSRRCRSGERGRGSALTPQLRGGIGASREHQSGVGPAVVSAWCQRGKAFAGADTGRLVGSGSFDDAATLEHTAEGRRRHRVASRPVLWWTCRSSRPPRRPRLDHPTVLPADRCGSRMRTTRRTARARTPLRVELPPAPEARG